MTKEILLAARHPVPRLLHPYPVLLQLRLQLPLELLRLADRQQHQAKATLAPAASLRLSLELALMEGRKPAFSQWINVGPRPFFLWQISLDLRALGW